MPIEPLLVGHLRRVVEVAHLVVQQEAGARDDDLHAVALLERVGHRHRVAARVHHRDVRRLVALVRPLERRRRRLRGLVQADRLAEIGGVRLRHQPVDRHVLVEVGIAEELRAIGVGALHRLGHQVDLRGRGEPHRLEVVALEDVQHLDQADAAGRGRRHRDHLVAAVGALDRRAPDRGVVLEILARDQAAVREHFLLEQQRRLAFVEAGRPLRGDAVERAREIGLLQRLARFVRHAVLRERRDRRRDTSASCAARSSATARAPRRPGSRRGRARSPDRRAASTAACPVPSTRGAGRRRCPARRPRGGCCGAARCCTGRPSSTSSATLSRAPSRGSRR